MTVVYCKCVGQSRAEFPNIEAKENFNELFFSLMAYFLLIYFYKLPLVKCIYKIHSFSHVLNNT